jgi:hypothetical protein
MTYILYGLSTIGVIAIIYTGYHIYRNFNPNHRVDNIIEKMEDEFKNMNDGFLD